MGVSIQTLPLRETIRVGLFYCAQLCSYVLMGKHSEINTFQLNTVKYDYGHIMAKTALELSVLFA